MNKNIRRYRRIVTKINKLEKDYKHLRDADFAAKTALLKMRLKSGESLEKILPEAFALVREVAHRMSGMRAFNVQLQGAIAVHEGKIAEMKTGEGKTLTITFAAYLNALEGKGVHVVTANDYLAQRDANWMGSVYKMLGLSVGSISSETSQFDRQVAYGADITYVTNNEVGFDFLKDNMLFDLKNQRQRGLHFAIIDEADSVLIDEAQTPLVISDSKKTGEEDKQLFARLNPIVKKLKKGVDFKVKLKESTATLTIGGIRKLEKLLGVHNLYQDGQVDYLYFIQRLLKAHALFVKDRDYIVENGQVVIVDEFTGRLMQSHRYFQGIHQAIEAKESLTIRDESSTLAQITFQHLFRRYQKMAGLTGTAKSAEKEFRMIYRKEVVEIPTNKKVIREDRRDRFFVSWEDKLGYLAWASKEYYFKSGSVLVGTRSIEKSQKVHEELLRQNVPSNVLNAKHTAQEAELISMAGQPETLTVATNMAGRGTDIELHEDVREKLGLVVYGMERHNARRIDNQLIGRAGRQGDPGITQFLISADDELIRAHFKNAYLKELNSFQDVAEGIEHRNLDQILLRAQKRMEDIFFDQRVLSYEFDKVLEVQRSSFYRQRNRVLLDDDLREETLSLIKKDAYRKVIATAGLKEEKLSKSEVQDVVEKLKEMMVNEWFKIKFVRGKTYSAADLRELVYESIEKYYADFEKYVTEEEMRKIEKTVTLKALDVLWSGYLEKVEEIQQGALVSSISKQGFFEDYEVQMALAYRSMLQSAPRVIVMTFLRTVDRMLKG